MRYVHRAALLSERVGERRFTAQLGVGRAMYLVLRTVEDGVTSQQEIAHLFALTKAAVSRHVATATERGWLRAERSPHSRRENVLTLTDSGRELVARGRQLQRGYEASSDKVFDEDDVAAAVRILKQMCEFLEGEDKS